MSIHFKNAADAIMWAEELGSRPVCDTHLAKLLIGPSGGGMTPMELRDLALSVTNATAAITPPWGLLFLSIYGCVNIWAVLDIQGNFASTLRNTEYGKDKDLGQLRKLVGVVCDGIRRKALHGKRLSRSRMAKIIGIPQQRFCENGWPELEAYTRSMIIAKLDMVEAKLNDVLRQMDLLS